jgi:AcrR family transcriptional regulator
MLVAVVLAEATVWTPCQNLALELGEALIDRASRKTQNARRLHTESRQTEAGCQQISSPALFHTEQNACRCPETSAMSEESKKPDRRKRRTKHSLSGALVELILEKPYDAITVQNVLDRADVGRSTFYAHYRDKEDLFLSDWEGLLDGFVRHLNWQNLNEGRFLPVRELFSHLRDYHSFYQALARSRKTELIFKTGHSHLTKGIHKALATYLADKSPPSVPLPLLANYLAGELFSFLKWWLDHNLPHPPERMDEMFHELVMPGFRAALGKVSAP